MIQGQSTSPDYPLTPLGKLQAQLAGIALKDIHFDQIYASDLERALETAIIISSNNLNTSKTDNKANPTAVQTNKLLREMFFGNFEGKTMKEYFLAAKEAGYGEGKSLWNYIPEGGEDRSDVRKRVEEFLDFLFESIIQNEQPSKDNKTKEHTILLATHAGWIWQLVRSLLRILKVVYQLNLPIILSYRK